MEVRLERELKLEAPDSFSLARLDQRFDGYVAASAELQRLRTVYYDTDDLRLARWGCSLRYREPGGWTLKLPLPEERGCDAHALARIEHEFVGGPEAIPAAALDLATAYLRGAVPHPVAELQTLRVSRRVRDAGGVDVAEIVEDDVRVITGGRVVQRFRQLEIELAENAPAAALEEIGAALREAGAGDPDPVPKEVLALGPAAAQPPIPVPTIDRTSSAGDLFRVAFAAATERLIRSDAALRTVADDPEPVHRARVAVRRMRSDLRTFAALLDAAWATELAQRLRWLGDGLGAARDADILSSRLRAQAAGLPEPDRPQFATLFALLSAGRRAAYAALASMLHDPRYVPLLDAIVEAAERPAFEPPAFEPAGDAVAPLMQATWRKLRKTVRARSRPPTDLELHRIRIRAKRVRYAAEGMAPYVGRPARAFARSVEALQTVLGEQHDAVVACARLRELGSRGEVAFVAGELTAREADAAERARRRWRACWQVAKDRRFWN